MNFEYTSGQVSGAAAFAKRVETDITPDAAKLDADLDASEAIIRRHLKTLGDSGFLALLYPEDAGGRGMKALEWLLYAEPLAGASPSTFLTAVNSALTGLWTLARYGSMSLVERWVPRVLAGEAISAFAFTEADSGSDPLAVGTEAKPVDGGWELNGQKVYVTNGPICDVALVLARTKPEGGANGLSLFAVPADAPGFNRGERTITLGCRGAMVGSLRFNRCRVGADALIGHENVGFGPAMLSQQWGQLAVAVGAVGMGEAAMRLSLARALERRSAGSKIIKHQEVSFKLAQMKMLTDTGRLLTQYAAWAIDEGQSDAPAAVSAAKVHTTEAMTRIANMAMQIFAGAGYVSGNPVERLYRDAKLGELLYGTTEIHRILLAQDVIGRFGNAG